MKQSFIIKRQVPRLLLFFAGWGMDEAPFADFCPEDTDFMICYDYRTFDFDETLISGYSSITLIAWSMGVYAAAHTLQNSVLPIDRRIAVNGTMKPVSNDKGIPPSVYQLTLDTLSERSLQKFRLRMCGSGALYNDFMQHAPNRSVKELGDELVHIWETALQSPPPSFQWDVAIIGLKDVIFPPDNQRNAWQETPQVIEKEMAHYDYLEQWIKN